MMKQKPKTKYRVAIAYDCYRLVEVEADNDDDAISLAHEVDYNLSDLEYSDIRVIDVEERCPICDNWAFVTSEKEPYCVQCEVKHHETAKTRNTL